MLPALTPGSLIDLVYPASEPGEDAVARIQAWAQQQWGVRVRLAHALLPPLPDGARRPMVPLESAQQRAEHLLAALAAPDSQAVWCGRGGYGSTHLLPWLQRAEVLPQTKHVLGFSDITTLHLWLQQAWGWQTLYAPGLEELSFGKVTPSAVESVAAHVQLAATAPVRLQPLNPPAMDTRTLPTTLTGGCLSLVCSHLGTANAPVLRHRTLLLEDIGEAPYRLDRLLDQLHRAILAPACGIGIPDAILLGAFEQDGQGGMLHAAEITDALHATVQRFASTPATASIPILRCANAGHAADMQTLPLGVPLTLTLGNAPMLRWSYPVP